MLNQKLKWIMLLMSLHNDRFQSLIM